MAGGSEDTVREPLGVIYEQRCKLLKQEGLVVWFTGLSGAGKTTIAKEVDKRLHILGKATYHLDGDNLRQGINSDLGFSKEDRDENIRRVSHIAALFQDAGIITLCSFISPYERMRSYAKGLVARNKFIEIYVKAKLDTCISRDPKGFYRIKQDSYTGLSSPYEEPLNPDLLINTDFISIAEARDMVINEILKRQ